MAKDIFGFEIEVGDMVAVSKKERYSTSLMIAIVNHVSPADYTADLLQEGSKKCEYVKGFRCVRPEDTTILIDKNKKGELVKNKLDFKKVAITGAFESMTRFDLTNELTKNIPGITINNTVTENTDYLLVPQDPPLKKSSKYYQALNFGTPILTESEVLDILGKT